MSYPAIARERAAERNKIRAIQREIYEKKARRLGRSIKCGEYGQHADQDGGCANDGSNCICECHDPRGAE